MVILHESIRNGFKNGKRDNSTLWLKRRLKYGPQGGNNPTGRPDPLSYSQKKESFCREKRTQFLKISAQIRLQCFSHPQNHQAV